MNPRLSVIIPVFNEKGTIEKIVSRVQAVPVSKEIIIVDDGSSDGTREILRNSFAGQDNLRVLFHDANQGKGAAIRTGIRAAQGEAVIIQDADLEYDPMDYEILLQALGREGANVVYGSRFLGKKNVTSPWHRFVNYFLTQLTNLLFSARLTDMETCYKLFRRDTINKIHLEARGFEIEPEITAKFLKAKEKIVEVPIAYRGRTFHEGKKIGWKDGVRAVALLFRYRFGRG